MTQVLPIALTHLVAFLLFIWVIKKYAVGPVLQLLDERRAKIADQFDQIDSDKKHVGALREEYEEHIRDKHCRAGACTELSRYVIIPELCKGCAVCKKHCPVGAIWGKVKEVHDISQERCIKCGQCEEHCPFDAIERV